MKNYRVPELRDSMSNAELVSYMFENGYTHDTKGLTHVQIFNLVMKMAKALELDLNVEQKFFLMCDERVIQCDAPAGGGKTTITLLKLYITIALHKKKCHTIGVMTYTKAATRDLNRRFNQIASVCNEVLRPDNLNIKPTDSPNIRSINSLTYNIVDQFKDKFNMNKFDIVDKATSNIVMRDCYIGLCRDGVVEKYNENIVESLVALYDLRNEQLCHISELEHTELFISCGMSSEQIDRLFEIYWGQLVLKNVAHFSDTTRMVVEMAKKEEWMMNFLTGLYSCLVVDEFQDVSESMYELIRLMSTNSMLLAMGDGDQAIYIFRGARADNCERFAEEFEGAVLCTMTFNRRCRENILNYSKEVLKLIPNRLPKNIRHVKTGGVVESVEYSDKVEVLRSLADKLKTYPKSKLSDVCIAYRKNATSYYLSNILTDAGIPYICNEEYQTGSDPLSESLDAILDLLKNPTSVYRIEKHLYKVCGINKKQNKLVGENGERLSLDDFMDMKGVEYFWELPLEEMQLRGTVERVNEELLVLEKAAGLLRRKGTMRDIISAIVPLLFSNYWDYTSTVKGIPKDLERLVLESYTVDMSYVEFRNMRREKLDLIERYRKRGEGVQLSTYHSVKGLEYKEVHLVELAAGVMPSLIITDGTSDAELQQNILTELRTFYVACTRAEDRLVTYWDVVNPSPFMCINDSYKESYSSESTSHDTEGSMEDLLSGLFADNKVTDTSGNTIVIDTDKIDLADIELEELSLELNLDLDDVEDVELVDEPLPTEVEKLGPTTLKSDDLGQRETILNKLMQNSGGLEVYSDPSGDEARGSDFQFDDSFRDISSGNVLDNILEIIFRSVV